MKNKKNNRYIIQNFRFIVQSAFALLCIWIGIEFYLFINYLDSGGISAFYSRPPGVDGFLPISSFMSFYLFLRTGEISMIHPAGFFIFTAILGVSLIFGKSFCSWLCPVGFLSEMLGDLGEKIFRKKIKMPRIPDYILRSLKYFLLGFLVYSVIFLMSTYAIKEFLNGPYNVMADIKMYYFFAKISKFSLIVIAVLFFLSIIYRNFWCRYLCPYGALLGITSFFSPNKIQRNVSSCIDCKLCTKVCPSFIKVHKVKTVISDECSSCMKCVESCPVKNTLMMKNVIAKKEVNKKWVGIAIVFTFMLITGIGIFTGYWQNKVSKDEYLYYHKMIDDLGHPTDTESIKRMNN